MNTKPKLIFYGGVGRATGANFLLQFEGKNILIDCGLRQGRKQDEEENFKPFPYNPADIDILLITHAHIDHIGRVPQLVKDGFKGKIISTIATKELALPMLEDALKVMHLRHPEKNIFAQEDVKKTLSLWQGEEYGRKIELAANCFVQMKDAGHILGSAVLEVFCGKRKIAFTGDLGNSPSPLLPDTEALSGPDYIVMESVYGDRNHEDKKERKEKLKQALMAGIKRGGEIVIPAFSLERTQILLYEINNMIEEKEISSVPVFLDSPLALKVTDIYKKHLEDFKKSVKEEIEMGDDIFNFPNLHFVKNVEESREIEKTKGSKIIIAGSGMSEGGRVVGHEARILGSPQNTLILIGYQAVGTLGRKLEEGVKEVEITPPQPLPEGEGLRDKHASKRQKIKIRAKIEIIKGYSSHKDSKNLLEFVEKATDSEQSEEQKSKLKKVFVCMGEPHSSLFFVQRLRDYLGVDAVYPEIGKEYILE